MYRSLAFTANKAMQRHRHFVLPYRSKTDQIPKLSCDVFISHRGIETKRSIAGLMHGYLRSKDIHSFLDYKTLMLGEQISYEIELALHQCKVGIPIFSPRYCESWYCLYELALLTEMGKKLVPIYWDIEPSQLAVAGHFPTKHAKRFGSAINKARDTVGITFDSSTGDWSKLLRDTYDAVQRIFLELDEPHGQPQRGSTPASGIGLEFGWEFKFKDLKLPFM